jgi:hypothetical protein
MSYDNDKKAFDKATAKIIKATGGRMSHHEASNRLRKAIDRQKNTKK